MKRGFKALAVLATVAAVSAGPSAYANCTEFGGFAIFQCADRAYFNAPPFTVNFDPNGRPTNVSAVFWQVGYGNRTLNTGLGSNGTGASGVGAFNGNDNGNFTPDVGNARVRLSSTAPPLGSLCLGSNNWGNTDVDGCCDNERDPNVPIANDNILNPLFDVFQVRNYGADPNNYPSDYWVQDSPMGALLRESGNTYFALAFVASMERTGSGDTRSGFYAFADVDNGSANALDPNRSNVVPWQLIPGARVPGDPNTGLVRHLDPNTGTSASRTATLAWDGVEIYSDTSSRPSTNPSVPPGGGMGTNPNEMGGVVRYVLEQQAISDPNNPVGSLDPNGWTAVNTYFPPTTSAMESIPADTCIRLHTYFGREPGTSTHSPNSCRDADCGDLGLDVASPASCVGGPLVSESPVNLKAQRDKGGNVAVTWSAVELTTTAYEVNSVSKKGVTKLGTVSAKGTGSGSTESYKFTVPASALKGTRTIEVVAVPSGAKQRAQIQ